MDSSDFLMVLVVIALMLMGLVIGILLAILYLSVGDGLILLLSGIVSFFAVNSVPLMVGILTLAVIPACMSYILLRIVDRYNPRWDELDFYFIVGAISLYYMTIMLHYLPMLKQ